MRRYRWPITILILWSATLGIWRYLDTRPPAWDPSIHLLLSCYYRDFLLHGTPVTTSWASFYPPLYHLSIIPALSLGIPSETKAVAMHVVYMAILLVGLYRLTRDFERPAMDAWLAGLILAGSYDVISV